MRTDSIRPQAYRALVFVALVLTEHFTSTGQNLWMPRASMAIRITQNNKLSFSWGRYGQFPSFRQLYGEVYNPDLQAERSTHYIAGWEHRLNDRTRIRVEAYETDLREGIYSPDLEWRAPRPLDLERGLVPVNGLLRPRLGAYMRNSLNGHTRGIELTLQRRSANRLSGWASYAYGYSRYADPADELSFWGSFTSGGSPLSEYKQDHRPIFVNQLRQFHRRLFSRISFCEVQSNASRILRHCQRSVRVGQPETAAIQNAKASDFVGGL